MFSITLTALETFLPWDLDSLFVSTMVLILTKFVDFSLMDNQSSFLDKAFTFLETMIASGNRIAAFRVIELRKLDEMLTEHTMNQHRPSTSSPAAIGTGPIMQRTISFPVGYQPTPGYLGSDEQFPPPPYTGLSDEGSGFGGEDLTAEQILAVAESMDMDGTDWLTFATYDYPLVDPQL